MAERLQPPLEDGPLARILRRAVTIPAFASALVAWTALLPPLLPVLALADLLPGRRAAVRAALAIWTYLAFELTGVVAVGTLVATGRASPARLYALEAWWADRLLSALLRLFRMRLVLEGLEQLRPGPFILVGNHVSAADALLPAAFASARLGIRLRYVAKAELLWDPCVDLAGHVLPNVFVRRGSADTPGDMKRVQGLLEGLGPGDGIVLLPEGTRFTEAKRAALLARREREGPREHLERDRRLRCLMPPRTGGLLALFERNPGADVVVMATAGLEGIVGLGDLWGGALLDRTLRVAFWRLPWSSVPAGRAERVEWLYDQWERLDAWLAAARGLGPPA